MKLVKIGEERIVEYIGIEYKMTPFIIEEDNSKKSTVIELKKIQKLKINAKNDERMYFIFVGVDPENPELLKKYRIPMLKGYAASLKKGPRKSYGICIIDYMKIDEYPNVWNFIINKMKEAMELDNIDESKLSNEQLEELKKLGKWKLDPAHTTATYIDDIVFRFKEMSGLSEEMSACIIEGWDAHESTFHPNKWIPIRTSKGVVYSEIRMGWGDEDKDWGLGIYFMSKEWYDELTKEFNAAKEIIDKLTKDSKILKATLYTQYNVLFEDVPKYENLLQEFYDLMNKQIESWKSVGEKPYEIKNIKIKFYSGYDKIYDGKFSIEEFFNNDVPALVETILTKFPDLFNKYLHLELGINSVKNGGARIVLYPVDMTTPKKEIWNLEKTIKREFITTLQKVKQQQKQKIPTL